MTEITTGMRRNAFILIAACAGLVLASCRSERPVVVTSDSVVLLHDTVRAVRTDTVLQRDSVYVERRMVGDTLFVTLGRAGGHALLQ